MKILLLLMFFALRLYSGEAVQTIQFLIIPAEDIEVETQDIDFNVSPTRGKNGLSSKIIAPLRIAINEVNKPKKLTVCLSKKLPKATKLMIQPLKGPGTLSGIVDISSELQTIFSNINMCCKGDILLEYTYEVSLKAGVIPKTENIVIFNLVDH
ncbi:MAG: hypothetical protein P0S95_08285 [Rhabdochlamydiaceae bacterium]|nr:hypothetical protein [Candidatus Amphrikana amoebophyrae]